MLRLNAEEIVRTAMRFRCSPAGAADRIDFARLQRDIDSISTHPNCDQAKVMIDLMIAATKRAEATHA